MNNDRFQVINNMKRFIKFIDNIIINYPRSCNILKERLYYTSYEILELIFYANVIDNRLDIQKKIISKISMLDFYLELSYDKKCISLKKYNYGSRELDTIKKMIFGWIKSNDS